MKPSRRSVDGFHPRLPGTHWTQQPKAIQAQSSGITQARQKTVEPKLDRSSDRRKVLLSFKTIAPFVLYALLGATAFTYQPVAELGIIVYGIVAFIKHIPSQASFMLVLILLTAIVVTQLIGRYDLGIIFASYAFLLLVVATVCLARELRTP